MQPTLNCKVIGTALGLFRKCVRLLHVAHGSTSKLRTTPGFRNRVHLLQVNRCTAATHHPQENHPPVHTGISPQLPGNAGCVSYFDGANNPGTLFELICPNFHCRLYEANREGGSAPQ